METLLARRVAMLVSPRRNHSSSCTIERRCTFLVVTSGKPSARLNRICQPNTLRVPVPVRSAFSVACAFTCHKRSRYCLIVGSTLRRNDDRLWLHRRRPPRQPQPVQPDENDRYFEYLPHRQPAEREIAE